MGQSSPRQPLPPRSKNRPPPSKKPGFGIVALLLLAGLGVFGGYEFRNGHGLGAYLPSLIHPKTPADVFPNQPALNLMVIGRDADYNDKDQVIKTHARSDMLMVAHVDFAHNQVALISIPRDTRAEIPGHGISKINAAHAYGGPSLSEGTVQTNFGIPSDKYVALDFEGFEQAIDLLGGVDLAVDKKMDYDDNWGHLHIHLRPGMQHLDGKQAMGFVRFRHSDSDLVRTRRQQTLIAAIKDKLHDPLTLMKLPQILSTIDKHINSDLTTDQKVVLAQFIHGLSHDQIHMDTLPSLETSGPYVATDWAKATPMIQSVFGVSPPENVADAGLHHRRHSRHHRLTRVAQLQ